MCMFCERSLSVLKNYQKLLILFDVFWGAFVLCLLI